jgi:hypothetical protein
MSGPCRRPQPEDLAFARAPPEVAVKVEFALAHPDTFPARNTAAPMAAPRRRRSSSGASGLSSVIQRPDTSCPAASATPSRLRVSAIPSSTSACSVPPSASLARTGGDEAVEQPVVAVFGQVDDAGGRIDAGGFVVEAAHRGQRHRIDLPFGIGGHFEHPAVIAVGGATIGRAGLPRRSASCPTA